MMGRLKLLLTSVGGLGIPRLIEHLREIRDLDLTIVGIDANEDAIGSHFVDAFCRVPFGQAEEYPDVVFDICRQHQIDLIVPFSDEEALALSKSAQRFHILNAKILCSPYSTTVRACNKFTFLSTLTEHGIATPKFFRPQSKGELELALRDLGYPSKRVIFKPLDGHGSRGVRVIDSCFDELDHVLNSKNETMLSLCRLMSLLEKREQYPDFLIMEYLEGEIFSVDVLVKNGRCVYTIPQRKLSPRHGSLEVGIVERNLEIEKIVSRIICPFDFEFLINIDMGYQRWPRDGAVLPYEVNVRPSAVISSTGAAGCFLLEEAIFQAMGWERPLRKFSRVKMMRFWNEKYFYEPNI